MIVTAESEEYLMAEIFNPILSPYKKVEILVIEFFFAGWQSE